MMKPLFRYLLVTHIPFSRLADGRISIDGLWARDLEGLVAATGPVRVVAPEYPASEAMPTWGPNAVPVGPESGLTFVGLPVIHSRRHWLRWPMVRAILRREVAQADVVHTSHGFPPWTGLAYAHDLGVAMGKKTVFVIAEDFHDVWEWERVRTASGRWQRWRWGAELKRLDARTKRSAATASITFLHTPAAVDRYRLHAKNGLAIRQPGHEAQDVISPQHLENKCRAILADEPLKIVAACRHIPLKGLDLLIQAVALVRQWGTDVELTIYGHGETTGEWQRLAARLDVEKAVRFAGVLSPGTEVYHAIAQAHVFAMPHRTTDFGRAFFDAMAGGTPVIAFRTMAAQGTVEEGVDGLLCPLDDVERLAAALRRCDQDRVLLASMARHARERGLRNTRAAWFQRRAEWVHELFPS
jgi:glycosyltransferase involved in cell wall biosynthesis